jgi:hypothetical protein
MSRIEVSEAPIGPLLLYLPIIISECILGADYKNVDDIYKGKDTIPLLPDDMRKIPEITEPTAVKMNSNPEPQFSRFFNISPPIRNFSYCSLIISLLFSNHNPTM